MLTKQDILLGMGTWAENRRVREPRRTSLLCGLLSGFALMRLVSGLFLANHSQKRVLPGGTPIAQARWISERRILGASRTGGVSFWPFLNSSIWWWLNSSTFLTETSCGKILMQIVIIVPGLGGWF